MYNQILFMSTKEISKFLFSALFVFAMTPAFSQFSAGLDLAFPNGGWSNAWGTGFGISGRYEAAIQPKLNWTASIGFLSFSGKNGNTNTAATIVPLIGGVKYYFQKSNAGVYGAADMGLFFPNHGGNTKFGFSPGLGYRLPKFDFAFRYNLVTDLSYWNLRVAYIFPGK
jgi:hypothetical protein